jgi:IBR domain, a half RING-finger domain
MARFAHPTGHSPQRVEDDAIRPPLTHVCFACLDEHPVQHIVFMPCAERHKVCRECLNQLFKAGTRNRESFPPKCCNVPLRLTNFIHHLKDEVQRRYHEVYAEYSSKEPLYCADVTCSRFLAELDPATEMATCPQCHKGTCTKCKRLMSDHREIAAPELGKDSTKSIPSHVQCPSPLPDEQKLKSLMTDNKWKACPVCRNAIERTDGCDHIECTCGADFCYGCGKLLGDGSSGCECSRRAPLHVPMTPLWEGWDAQGLDAQQLNDQAQQQMMMQEARQRQIGLMMNVQQQQQQQQQLRASQQQMIEHARRRHVQHTVYAQQYQLTTASRLVQGRMPSGPGPELLPPPAVGEQARIEQMRMLARHQRDMAMMGPVRWAPMAQQDMALAGGGQFGYDGTDLVAS